VALVADLLALLPKALEPFVLVAIGAGLYELFQRAAKRAGSKAFEGATGPFLAVLNEHEGRLAEHLDRLERIRAHLAIVEGRANKALTILDGMRGERQC
jgi:hypothetical protein